MVDSKGLENPLRIKLLDKARSLPARPGCYLMKNSREEVIYVGKAKALNARVVSYFQNTAHTAKTAIMVSHIREFDFVLTESESEAFVLENNLIKKYGPKYNIMMRDDKSYPYIVVDMRDDFPRLVYQRKIVQKDYYKIYGPFSHGSNISDVLRILTKSFELRDCTLREFKSRKTPCLLYQIKQCSAPCVGYLDKEAYLKDLKLALNFFESKGEHSLDLLKSKMEQAAESEYFEQAALLRDYILTLEEFLGYSIQKNIEYHGQYKDVDIVAYHIGEVEVDLAIYTMRRGTLLGHKNFHFPLIDCVEEEEKEIVNYLFQYYYNTHDLFPELIIFETDEKSEDNLKKALTQISTIKLNEDFDEFKSLLALTKEYAKEQQRVRLKNEDSVFLGLDKLADLLNLAERPVRIECYDIAIFQGSSPCASMVVYLDGKPAKKEYRYYHLEERPEGNNDFAMMAEVLKRRITKDQLPDLFVVDGGKGQVNIFLEVLKENNLDIPVVGIAKSKGKSHFRSEKINKSEERLIIPGRLNPYLLNKNKTLLKIITGMRDEAHRFSRKLHHKQEKKRVFSSWLDEITGIGPKTKQKILAQIHVSPEILKTYSLDQLREELLISKKMAEKIKNYFDKTRD